MRGLVADRKCPPDQPPEQGNHGQHTEESEFFGNDGEQKIGVRLGQIEQLLDARTQANAEPLPAPEGDQRMRQLVALAERIRPGIHESDHPLQAIR